MTSETHRRVPTPPTPVAGSSFLFTSESVNEGHPDKLCDQISDAILDACLAQDKHAKVACETAAKTGHIFLLGEINTTAEVDFEAVTRACIKRIGYDSEDKGLDYKTCVIHNHLEQQSPEIADCVFVDKSVEDYGAGDQGIMFGYATDESPDCMPMTHSIATNLAAKLTEVRKSGLCPFFRPDGKTQVTCEYCYCENGHLFVKRIHTILISCQHSPEVSQKQLREALFEHVVKPVCPSSLLDTNTILHLNPSGAFTRGGPHADAGLTGRKIIVDTYGGWGAHGGGAFSGKDPTKVDRSAAYAARWVAKSVVKSHLARRCLVQLSYAIGVSEPLSIHVNTFGSHASTTTDQKILQLIKKNFDLRPGCILRDLNLRLPIYEKTAAYCHFGREAEHFSWEQPKQLD